MSCDNPFKESAFDVYIWFFESRKCVQMEKSLLLKKLEPNALTHGKYKSGLGKM